MTTTTEHRDGEDVERVIPRHPFTTEQELHLFEFTDLDDLECPDCGEHSSPANLGNAVDWALGHKYVEEAADHA